MPKKYDTVQVIKNICSCLVEKDVDTPSGIARCVNYDPRTISKYVDIAKGLGIIECNEIEMGRNKVRLCKINPDYMEIFNNLEKETR